MDDEQRRFEREYREKQEREKLDIERARAKLNDEQRARLDIHAERLRDEGLYAPKHEIAIANIIHEDRDRHHQSADIKAVFTTAHNEAVDREAKEELARNVLALREAEQQREQQAQREIQEQQRQRDAELIARRQRDFETTRMIQQGASDDRQRHQNGRYNELRSSAEEPSRMQAENPRAKDSDWRATARELFDRAQNHRDDRQEREKEADKTRDNVQAKGLTRGGRRMM